MQLEFAGIEGRLDGLSERLARLDLLRAKSRADFDADPICATSRTQSGDRRSVRYRYRPSIIALEKAEKPRDYYEACNAWATSASCRRRLRARSLRLRLPKHTRARIRRYRLGRGVRNLQHLEDLLRFAELIRRWLNERRDRPSRRIGR